MAIGGGRSQQIVALTKRRCQRRLRRENRFLLQEQIQHKSKAEKLLSSLTFWLGSNAVHLLPTAQCAFLQVTTAQSPFHMLPLEYPPLTLLPFSLALIAPIAYYQLAFALLMSFTSVLIYWLLLRYGPRGGAFIFALYLFIGALGTAQQRFDLIPAAFTLLCIIAAERKHWTWAYIALAFAVLLKIYPILLLPTLFIAEQQAAARMHILPKVLTLKSLSQHLWYSVREVAHLYWKNFIIFLSVVLGITAIFCGGRCRLKLSGVHLSG